VLSHVAVDGILAVDAPQLARVHCQSPAAQSIPVISMGAECYRATDFVRVDLLAGTRQVMQHLIGNGFRRIAHATFMRKDSPEASRRLGYARAMREAHLKPEFIYYPLSERQRPIIRRLIQHYIRQHGRPDAIFCHSDDAALGIYRGLCDLHIRVPEEVALVGCDGIQDTEYLECPLTTIVQPVARMCATAWEFMIERLDNPKRKRQQSLLEPKLEIRKSSGNMHRTDSAARA